MKLKSGPWLLTTLIFIILMSLGFWQLNRLKSKEALLNQISSNLKKPHKDLPYHLQDSEINSYTKYKLNGRFISSKDILLYSSAPSHTQKQGYFVITPFLTDFGKYILVNRGWIPQSYTTSHKVNEKWKVSEDHVSITAVIMKPGLPSIFMLNNDTQNNLWLYYDLEEMGNFVKVPAEPRFYMVLLSEDNSNNGLIMMEAHNFLNLKNDHLGYAITWLSLALALIVIYYIKYK